VAKQYSRASVSLSIGNDPAIGTYVQVGIELLRRSITLVPGANLPILAAFPNTLGFFVAPDLLLFTKLPLRQNEHNDYKYNNDTEQCTRNHGGQRRHPLP
jgi:hypothetical protein